MMMMLTINITLVSRSEGGLWENPPQFDPLSLCLTTGLQNLNVNDFFCKYHHFLLCILMAAGNCYSNMNIVIIFFTFSKTLQLFWFLIVGIFLKTVIHFLLTREQWFRHWKVEKIQETHVLVLILVDEWSKITKNFLEINIYDFTKILKFLLFK